MFVSFRPGPKVALCLQNTNKNISRPGPNAIQYSEFSVKFIKTDSQAHIILLSAIKKSFKTRSRNNIKCRFSIKMCFSGPGLKLSYPWNRFPPFLGTGSQCLYHRDPVFIIKISSRPGPNIPINPKLLLNPPPRDRFSTSSPHSDPNKKASSPIRKP